MGWRDSLANWIRPAKHTSATLEEVLSRGTTKIPLLGNPTPPIRQPDQGSAERDDPKRQTADLKLYGATGTPIISGFLTDMQEYNPNMQGRYALPTFEQMRRSDADVAATLTACKLPIRCADMVIQPGVQDNEPEYALAEEIADFVKENLFGGLEYENSRGDKFSQSLDSVIENALLCLDFGCSASEDLWAIDQDRVRLQRLAPRLPLTFYQFPVDADGETLTHLVQWGYRGADWVTSAVPASKISLFSFRKEGANFFGRAFCREMYQHWFIKTALYRIDSIACERGAAGVPHIELAERPDPTDRSNAIAWVSNLSANENTGIVTQSGSKFKIEGVTGSVHPILPSIQHHSEMICRAPLAMFMALGTTATGSRSLGNTMLDFFQLMEYTIARFVCNTISDTTIRRMVDYNFPRGKGKKLPYPRLDIPHIAVINPLELANAIKELGDSKIDILQPDNELENWFRKQIGAPAKGRRSRERFAPTVVRIMETSDQNPQEIEDPSQAGLPLRGSKKPKALPKTSVEMRELVGRTKWHGLDISIENDVGSVRRWGANGETRMQFPYGYIRRTEGADGDHVDCYLGSDSSAKFVYVVHQRDPNTGVYDEDKCFLDFPSADAAMEAYRAHRNDGDDALASMTTLRVSEFIEKVKATFDQPAKIHAADSKQAIVDNFHRQLKRALHPHEHKHDFAGHVRRQDQTQTAIRRILASVKLPLMRDAARRASHLTPDSLGTLQLPADRYLHARIQKSTELAHRYGRDQVYAERYRATKRGKNAAVMHLSKTVEAEPGESAQQDTPDLIARASIADLHNWVTSRTKGAHVDAYTKGLRDEVLERAIEDNLAAGSDAMLDRIALEAARSSVAGGRYSALLELASEISRYARSEAMDQNTCGPCRRGDGDEWKSLDEVTWSPGDDCEGQDACRGQLLPIFADEGTVQLG